MNTNKKISLDPSKLYGFKIVSSPLNQQQLPIVIGSKIGKAPPAPVILPIVIGSKIAKAEPAVG